MGRPLKLESFDLLASVNPLMANISEEKLEEERLQAFDRGYKAGWDDSATAYAANQQHLSTELASNLQALSFTYHEARSSVLLELEGLVRGLVDQVLPKSVGRALGDLVVSQISNRAQEVSEAPIEVVVSPANIERVESLISEMVKPPTRVLKEQTLGDGQAFLRFGPVEHKLDLDRILEEISESISEFYENIEASRMAHA